MNSISLNLKFAGAILPVVDGEDGFQRVPLKPICEALGLVWERQYKKMQVAYYARRLGICVEQMYYAGQSRQMVLIRLDRVAAYLNTLNPESIRSAGNEAAADFLEQKHTEWDDLIHAYEQQRGQMFTDRSIKKAMAIARVDRIKDGSLRQLALAELGITVRLHAATPGPQSGDLLADVA